MKRTILFTLLLFLSVFMTAAAAGQKDSQTEETTCPVCTDIFGNLTFEGCMIKDNINSKGDRIYHCPLWRDYDKTRIDEEKGERWFCSEEEARAAGWRAPKYKTGSCRILPAD